MGVLTIASLEQLRRSLVMAPPDGPAAALTNRDAADLIARVTTLEELRTGVIDLLQANSPVPARNAQLKRFCSDLARLLANTRTPSVTNHRDPGPTPTTRRRSR